VSDLTAYVRLEFEIQVSLPEGVKDDGEGEPTDETRERAIEAALSALPQNLEVFIDGEDKEPARVFIEVSEGDVSEVRVE